MENRINIQEKGADAMKAMQGFGAYLLKSSLEKPLLHLVYFRVSQLNGCAFCLDMHSKDLLETGEVPQRLFVLDAWQEAPFYTERERAALAWAEALTRLNGIVSAEVYKEASARFTEEELIDLTIGVIAINSYNRLNLAFPNPAAVGSYRPGMFRPVQNQH